MFADDDLGVRNLLQQSGILRTFGNGDELAGGAQVSLQQLSTVRRHTAHRYYFHGISDPTLEPSFVGIPLGGRLVFLLAFPFML